MKNSLQIKRKYKSLTRGKDVWWFVVHSQEETLCKLADEWENVKVQTGWTLQHCYKPQASADGDSDPGTVQSPTTSNSLLPTASTTLSPQQPLTQSEIQITDTSDKQTSPSHMRDESSSSLTHLSNNISNAVTADRYEATAPFLDSPIPPPPSPPPH